MVYAKSIKVKILKVLLKTVSINTRIWPGCQVSMLNPSHSISLSFFAIILTLCLYSSLPVTLMLYSQPSLESTWEASTNVNDWPRSGPIKSEFLWLGPELQHFLKAPRGVPNATRAGHPWFNPVSPQMTAHRNVSGSFWKIQAPMLHPGPLVWEQICIYCCLNARFSHDSLGFRCTLSFA